MTDAYSVLLDLNDEIGPEKIQESGIRQVRSIAHDSVVVHNYNRVVCC